MKKSTPTPNDAIIKVTAHNYVRAETDFQMKGYIEKLDCFGGTVYQTSLSNEDEVNLKKALEHEQVSASADEMLELE